MSTTSLNPKSEFEDELARFGPAPLESRRPPSLAESRAYCRRLARRHYENFTVASWLLPGDLRPHFFSVYAYCRWADDLADETFDRRRSLDLLDWWEQQLEECYGGHARHPVFVALGETIRRFEIPREPFLDLLCAFRQDQTVTQYQTFEELLDYCRRSANPVGRLVLYLAGCHDERRTPAADSICTGLQLANFWQDVARDWERGRIYMPLETQQRFGLEPSAFERRKCDDAFRRMMEFEVARARQHLQKGLELVPLVPRTLRVDVALFAHGGLAILDRIEQIDFDVWRQRPVLTKREAIGLFARCWWKYGRPGISFRTDRGDDS